MKNYLIFLLFIIFSFPVFSGEADSVLIAKQIDKATFIYAQKDSSVLMLDKYRMKKSTDIQACIFFLFGGGFTNGDRNDPDHTDYLHFLALQGYTVIAIDYRLGLSGKKHNIGVTNYKPLQDAINCAVSDLYDATLFSIKHASEWHIDTTRFIISGSSAGAIAVMQAEYENRNKMSSSLVLPYHFQYAGVISFSGAIFRTDGGLKWNKQPCPVLMFHGDKDGIVPYNRIRFFQLGFFGSKYISGNLRKNKFPYWFISFKEAAHEVAVDAMNEYQTEVAEFIRRFILNGEKSQIEMYINEMGKEKKAGKQSYKDIY